MDKYGLLWILYELLSGPQLKKIHVYEFTLNNGYFLENTINKSYKNSKF